MTFDSAGGFEQLHATLSGHLADLGQFPVAGFVGYGVLQNLAQNPAISRAISVVADEVTKNWIEIKGGEQEDAQRELTSLPNQLRVVMTCKEFFAMLCAWLASMEAL